MTWPTDNKHSFWPHIASADYITTEMKTFILTLQLCSFGLQPPAAVRRLPVTSVGWWMGSVMEEQPAAPTANSPPLSGWHPWCCGQMWPVHCSLTHRGRLVISYLLLVCAVLCLIESKYREFVSSFTLTSIKIRKKTFKNAWEFLLHLFNSKMYPLKYWLRI